MESNPLFDEIVQALMDRRRWESRQNSFYEMRHNGLRRKKLPFPGAADLHYPLADSQIETLKPYYYQILFSEDLIARFVAKSMDKQSDADGVAYWYNDKLSQKSNIETEILVVIDFMLMCGRSIMKSVYDVKNKKLRHGGIDPVFFIVPGYTEELEDADFMTEVKQISLNQYKRLGDKYNQDPDLLKRITGTNSFDPEKKFTKYRREGINIPLDGDQIILWENYEHMADGSWNVSWFSPSMPKEPLRVTQVLSKPYLVPPYTDFYTEVKDKGFYSPRGIPEIVASFEAFLNKSLNEAADYQTFVNRPIYTSDGQIVNMQNYKLTPGQYVPGNLKKVEQSPNPIPFQEMETKMKSIAEYRVGVPDYNIGSQNSGMSDPTATEVHAITGLMQQKFGLKIRLFRKSLAALLQKDWLLLREYERNSLEYFQKSEMKKIEPEVFDLDYSIEPTGSVDNINRQFVFQKAVARRQMFLNVPWINQQELDKSVLEADDPRLVERLFVNPNDIKQDQAEEQADEIGNMQLGFPVKTSPEDDDMIHIVTLIQFIQQRMAKQLVVEPQWAGLLLQHGYDHQNNLLQTPQGKAKLKQLDQHILGGVIGYLKSMAQQGSKNIINITGQPPAPGAIPASPGAMPLPQSMGAK